MSGQEVGKCLKGENLLRGRAELQVYGALGRFCEVLSAWFVITNVNSSFLEEII